LKIFTGQNDYHLAGKIYMMTTRWENPIDGFL